jgi:hypothetical protein
MKLPKPALGALTFVTCFLAIVMGIYYVQTSGSPARQNASGSGKVGQSSGLLVTINNSGSTNTLPYTLSVFNDGSAVLESAGTTRKTFPSGSIDARTLESLLQQIGDVTVLTGGRCMKSVSFGTVTKISYKNKTSGDISCTSNASWPQAGYELSKFINDMAVKLRLSSFLGRLQ